MKRLIILLTTLLVATNISYAIETDTVWRTDFGSTVNDYKISADENNILMQRDGAYDFLDASTGEVIWTLPSIDLTGQYFFMPNQPNKALIIKNLKSFYIIDTQQGFITDSIIIEDGSERIPTKSDLSFDGRYLAGTYVTKNEYVKYSGGGGSTHGFYNLYVVDLLERRVVFDGAEMISGYTVKFDNKSNKLIRQFFNPTRLDYILFENIVSPNGVETYTKELMHIHTIDYFPGYVDIDFTNTRDAFIAFPAEGKFQRYSYETNKIDSIFSPYIGGGSYALIDISKDDKYLACTESINALVEIENGKTFLLNDLESSGWYNLKFVGDGLNILYQRRREMYLINYDYLTTVESEETEYQTIFPNPTNSDVTTTFNVDTASEFIAKLYDVNSNLLFDTNLGFLNNGKNEYNLNLNSYPPSTYFLTVHSGSEYFNFKIIKGE